MTDLETAAAPSKFVDIAIKHPTVTLSVRQSQHAKIAHETSWSLSNRSHGNYGTQFYTTIDDDPRPAPTTCHHEISDAITFRKPQCTTTAQPNIRNAQSQTLCHQDTLTPVPLHNDPSLMAHMLHAITTSTTSAQHSKQRTPRKMIYESNTFGATKDTPAITKLDLHLYHNPAHQDPIRQCRHITQCCQAHFTNPDYHTRMNHDGPHSIVLLQRALRKDQ